MSARYLPQVFWVLAARWRVFLQPRATSAHAKTNEYVVPLPEDPLPENPLPGDLLVGGTFLTSRRSSWLQCPQDIYRKSLLRAWRVPDVRKLPEGLRPLAVRLVHAQGRTDIARLLSWRGRPWEDAREALRQHRTLFADGRMTLAGISSRRWPPGAGQVCTLEAVGVQEAKDAGKTRSALAMQKLAGHMHQAIVVIGNAPTALFQLLEMWRDGAPLPAVLFAFPVGFVGAAESKRALLRASRVPPFVTLRGRSGGSALAAAAINSLLQDPADEDLF